MAPLAQRRDRVGRPSDGLARDVEDAVDVQENGGHGTRVYGDREAIRVTRSVAVPRREIELRFSRSSGPGGQHAQRTETRVEAVFDVEASSALTERQERVCHQSGPGVARVAQDERSQWRNRELAVDGSSTRSAPRSRCEERGSRRSPARTAKERRLAGKRRRSDVKRLREPPETQREAVKGMA